jgi:hypothetical protein
MISFELNERVRRKGTAIIEFDVKNDTTCEFVIHYKHGSVALDDEVCN